MENIAQPTRITRSRSNSVIDEPTAAAGRSTTTNNNKKQTLKPNFNNIDPNHPNPVLKECDEISPADSECMNEGPLTTLTTDKGFGSALNAIEENEASDDDQDDQFSSMADQSHSSFKSVPGPVDSILASASGCILSDSTEAPATGSQKGAMVAPVNMEGTVVDKVQINSDDSNYSKNSHSTLHSPLKTNISTIISSPSLFQLIVDSSQSGKERTSHRSNKRQAGQALIPFGISRVPLTVTAVDFNPVSNENLNNNIINNNNDPHLNLSSSRDNIDSPSSVPTSTQAACVVSVAASSVEPEAHRPAFSPSRAGAAFDAESPSSRTASSTLLEHQPEGEDEVESDSLGAREKVLITSDSAARQGFSPPIGGPALPPSLSTPASTFVQQTSGTESTDGGGGASRSLVNPSPIWTRDLEATVRGIEAEVAESVHVAHSRLPDPLPLRPAPVHAASKVFKSLKEKDGRCHHEGCSHYGTDFGPVKNLVDHLESCHMENGTLRYDLTAFKQDFIVQCRCCKHLFGSAAGLKSHAQHKCPGGYTPSGSAHASSGRISHIPSSAAPIVPPRHTPLPPSTLQSDIELASQPAPARSGTPPQGPANAAVAGTRASSRPGAATFPGNSGTVVPSNRGWATSRIGEHREARGEVGGRGRGGGTAQPEQTARTAFNSSSLSSSFPSSSSSSSVAPATPPLPPRAQRAAAVEASSRIASQAEVDLTEAEEAPAVAGESRRRRRRRGGRKTQQRNRVPNYDESSGDEDYDDELERDEEGTRGRRGASAGAPQQTEVEVRLSDQEWADLIDSIRSASPAVFHIDHRSPSLRKEHRLLTVRVFALVIQALADPSVVGGEVGVQRLWMALNELPSLLYVEKEQMLSSAEITLELRELNSRVSGLVPAILQLASARRQQWAEAQAQRPAQTGPRAPVLRTERIRNLLREGCISKAYQNVESCMDKTLVSSDLSGPKLERVRSKFPPACARMDALPAVPADVVPWQITGQELVDAINSLPKQSASGMNGWTFDLLRVHCVRSKQLVRHLLSLTNSMLRGVLPQKEQLLVDRIFALEKPNGDVRPVCIASCLVRLCNKAIARAASPAAASFLVKDGQFGVGIPGGTEVAAHGVHLFLQLSQPGQMVAQLDVSNAFNEMRRACIWLALEEIPADSPHCELRGLLPLLKVLYGGDSLIRTRDGSDVTVCSTGVRQGDPLAPMLFSLGLSRVLKRLKAGFGDRVSILAYLDDVHLLGNEVDVRAAVDEFASIALDIAGLRLNRQKTKFLAAGVDGVVLGCPVGSSAFVQGHIRDVCDRATRTIAFMRQSDLHQCAFPLVKHSINFKVGHLGRLTSPRQNRGAFQEFDAMINDAILYITGSTSPMLPLLSVAVRALPDEFGGVGFRLAAETGPVAYTASFGAAMVMLCKWYPSFATLLNALYEDLALSVPHEERAAGRDSSNGVAEDVVESEGTPAVLGAAGRPQGGGSPQFAAAVGSVVDEGRGGETVGQAVHGIPNASVSSALSRSSADAGLGARVITASSGEGEGSGAPQGAALPAQTAGAATMDSVRFAASRMFIEDLLDLFHTYDPAQIVQNQAVLINNEWKHLTYLSILLRSDEALPAEHRELVPAQKPISQKALTTRFVDLVGCERVEGLLTAAVENAASPKEALAARAQKALWRSYSEKGSGEVFQQSFREDRSLSSYQFALNLRRRLLMPILEGATDPDLVVFCGRCRRCTDEEDPAQSIDPNTHAFTCSQMQFARKQQHDAGCAKISALFCRLRGKRFVTREAPLQQRCPQVSIVADGLFLVPGEGEISWDASVACCASRKALRLGSDETVEAAAVAKIREKDRKYSQYLELCSLTPASFVPILTDCTGRLCAESETRLHAMLGHGLLTTHLTPDFMGKWVKELKSDLRWINAAHTGHMVQTFLENIRTCRRSAAHIADVRRELGAILDPEPTQDHVIG